MRELWVPEATNKPDINNMYDMMLLMQETLLGIEADEQRLTHARFALEALGAHFNRMQAEERRVALCADTALYGSGNDAVRMVYDIGIQGELSAIKYVQLANLQFGLSLAVETEETFTPTNPDDRESTQLELVTPITSVRYIETIAA